MKGDFTMANDEAQMSNKAQSTNNVKVGGYKTRPYSNHVVAGFIHVFSFVIWILTFGIWLVIAPLSARAFCPGQSAQLSRDL